MGTRWTVRDVAAFLDVAESTVLRWRHQGDLPDPIDPRARPLEWDPAVVKVWARDWFPRLREDPEVGPETPWWDAEDVASYLGVEVITVQRYNSQDRIPKPARHFGRFPVWEPRVIIEWAKQRPSYNYKDRPSKHRGEEDQAEVKPKAPPTPRGKPRRPSSADRTLADELWGYGEIAAHMNVAPETVRGYKKEMPEPERYMGRSPVWRKGAVLDWIAGRPAAGWNGERPGRRRAETQAASE